MDSDRFVFLLWNEADYYGPDPADPFVFATVKAAETRLLEVTESKEPRRRPDGMLEGWPYYIERVEVVA